MRWMLACLIVLVAGQARADLTAVYENPEKTFRMTVEIAASGDVRGEIAAKPGAFVLKLRGQCYFVAPSATGHIVDRCDDAMAAMSAVIKERSPAYAKVIGQIGKLPFGNKPLFTKGGDVTVQGRRGTAYYFAQAPADKAKAVLVISNDPDLAPLGPAIADQSELSPFRNPVSDQMAAIIKTGGPLAVASAELTTLSHDTINSTRFALPGPVESRDAIIRRLRSTTTGLNIQVP